MRLVRPTARGWVLLVGACLWFAVGTVNHRVLPCLFACGGLALGVASLVVCCLSGRGIELERGPVGDAAMGQVVGMPVLVRNRRARRRQSVLLLEKCSFAAEGWHSVSVSALGPLEERVVARRVLAMRRGEFMLDRVVLRSGDPAGLFCADLSFRLPKRLIVLPGVVPLADLRLRRHHAVVSPSGTPMSGSGMSQEFHGVRQYSPSDGLRHIHWRSSAKAGRLMVREFERNAVVSVAVLVDAFAPNVSGPEHGSNLEYVVRAGASVARHVAGLYCRLAFGAGGATEVLIPPAPASRAEWDVLYSLALLQPGRVALADVALRLGERLPRETVVYCFSLSTSVRLAQALRVLQDQGMTVRWFCAASGAFGRARGGAAMVESAGMDRGAVGVVQLHPGVPLGRVLLHAA